MIQALRTITDNEKENDLVIEHINAQFQYLLHQLTITCAWNGIGELKEAKDYEGFAEHCEGLFPKNMPAEVFFSAYLGLWEKVNSLDNHYLTIIESVILCEVIESYLLKQKQAKEPARAIFIPAKDDAPYIELVAEYKNYPDLFTVPMNYEFLDDIPADKKIDWKYKNLLFTEVTTLPQAEALLTEFFHYAMES